MKKNTPTLANTNHPAIQTLPRYVALRVSSVLSKLRGGSGSREEVAAINAELAPRSEAPPPRPTAAPSAPAVPDAAPASIASEAPVPGLAQRISVAIGAFGAGNELVQQVVTLERDLAAARQQLTQAQNELGAERTLRLRAESDLQRATAQQRDVADTVASLGFDPSKLPGQVSAEQLDRTKTRTAAEENLEAVQRIFPHGIIPGRS